MARFPSFCGWIISYSHSCTVCSEVKLLEPMVVSFLFFKRKQQNEKATYGMGKNLIRGYSSKYKELIKVNGKNKINTIKNEKI